jgi:predicted AlkP superfamily pyrophosphatase or phosphodiesterase
MPETRTITRRSFLKTLASISGAAWLGLGGLGARTILAQITGSAPGKTGRAAPRKLIFVAIDGLHPKYLDLNAKGFAGGKPGDWLLPHLRAFFEASLWYPNAQCYLPAATDMNHLNALAGTSSAQTGVIGVWGQPTGWNSAGRAIISHSDLAVTRDDQGRQVDTLFHAFKRKRPEAKTLLISGKEWVAEMFRSQRAVDLLVTGSRRPGYLPAPVKTSFAKPPSDADAQCQPESGRLYPTLKEFSLGNALTRLYTGQRSLLTLQMEKLPERFPHDQWIVESTLAILDREDPDLAYILLAECDDGGHILGSAWDPSEFAPAKPRFTPPPGCRDVDEYQLVSARNPLLYREPILANVRDVDAQFGRLIDGLSRRGLLDRSCVIVLSDHSSLNHLATDDFSSTDAVGLLKKAGLIQRDNVFAFSVSSYGALYWRDRKETVPEAKKLLLEHAARNPQTGADECPWLVLDREEMRAGVPGVCLPGELWHEHFVGRDAERSMIWPDLFLLGRNGWQIPVYNGLVPNVGVTVPSWTPPFRVYNGGHGALDTMPILAAIHLPGGQAGVRVAPIRIGDLGATAARLFDLELRSTVIGKNLL